MSRTHGVPAAGGAWTSMTPSSPSPEGRTRAHPSHPPLGRPLEGKAYLDVGRCGLETSYTLALTLSIAVATLDFSADSSADPQMMVLPLAR